MCLARVFTDTEMAEYLEGQPEVIEVWKYVEIRNNVYVSPYVGVINNMPQHQYRNGLNISISGPGFFFYLDNLPAAREAKFFGIFHHNTSDAIKCYVRKGDIKQIGEFPVAFNGPQCFPTLVASQAVFPHFPEVEARWEDLPKEEIAESRPKTVAAPFPPIKGNAEG